LLRSVAGLLGDAPVEPAAPARAEAGDGRLLDENVQLMGRVSLLERATGLFALRSRDEVARRFAELLRLESGARTLELWASPREEGELGQTCVLGEAPSAPAVEIWQSEAGARGEALRSGRAVSEPARAGGAADAHLLVPCARAGRLLAVARLTPGSGQSFGARELDHAARLGELAGLALDAADERDRLARSSFRDPRTNLPGREFLDEVGRTEVHKAHRFGRRLSLLRVDIEGFDVARDGAAVPALVAAIGRTLRTTDVLAAEDGRRFWVLVTDTDPLGGVVLKRRIAERLRDVLRDARLARPGARRRTSRSTANPRGR
jgi:GGDEF domain-containing protein